VEVDLLPSVDCFLGTNALQERFALHTLPFVSPRFALPRLLPAPREPETRDSSRSLLPEGADHRIRLIYGINGELTSGLEPLTCSSYE